MNHMDRLNALVAVRAFVDENPTLPDDEQILPNIKMGDLRAIVFPTTPETK